MSQKAHDCWISARTRLKIRIMNWFTRPVCDFRFQVSRRYARRRKSATEVTNDRKPKVVTEISPRCNVGIDVRGVSVVGARTRSSVSANWLGDGISLRFCIPSIATRSFVVVESPVDGGLMPELSTFHSIQMRSNPNSLQLSAHEEDISISAVASCVQ